MDISVIIPSYNHATYIAEAIQSVLRQTVPAQEVIVVDDGSTDQTREVVAQFPAPVRYIYQPNRGLSAARNTGIQASMSKWVAFLDADDWWLPEKIRLQTEALERNPSAVLVYCSVWLQRPDGKRIYNSACDPSRLWPRIRYQNCTTGSGSAVLVRKDVVVEAGGFNENLTACEDWDLWVRLALRYPFASVREPVVVGRQHDSSMSTAYERMLANMEKIMEGTLLQGLSGWQRFFWRRRIRSAELFRAALSARAADLHMERNLLRKSLLQWPSPLFIPLRWAALARNILGPKRYSFLASPVKRARKA